MKKVFRLYTTLLLIMAMCIALFVGADNIYAAEGYEPSGFKFSGKIVLIGDSTVCDYPESYITNYNRYGWGMKLGAYFYNIKVENLALGGTSSRTFLNYENYNTLEKDLAQGDYLFIQFGHNDECITLLDRCTYAGLDQNTLDSEGKNSEGKYSYEFFLKKYIDMAKDRGAVPILITPITCLGDNGEADYEKHVPYQEAMIKLGEQLNVPVVDMTTKTAEVYNDLYNNGKGNESFDFHCIDVNDTSKIDHFHLSGKGADMVASLIAPETKSLGLILGDYLIAGHKHDYDVVVTKAVTCVEDGEKKYTCKICGDKYTETVKAQGHEWDSGMITKEPTETETGDKTYTCTVCGETKTESVPVKEKKDDTTEQPATEQPATEQPADPQPATTQQKTEPTTQSTTEEQTTSEKSTETAKVKKPKAPSSVKLKNTKDKKLTIKWGKVKGVKGYEIQYSLNKSFTKSKKTKLSSGTSLTVKNLKKKKYYVRVRAYTKDSNGKKVYSKWSSVKKIKIKR